MEKTTRLRSEPRTTNNNPTEWLIVIVNLIIKEDLISTYKGANHRLCQNLVKLLTLYRKEGLIDETTLSILTEPIFDAYRETREHEIVKIDEEIAELVDAMENEY